MTMIDKEFREFLNLLMCADPTPLTDEGDGIIRGYANRAAQERGYRDWYEAYHDKDL